MSLIMDAQKAAQREKDRRTAGAGRTGSPLLVPLRSKGGAGFDWQRVILAAGALGTVGAVVFVVLQQNRDTVPRALRTPGPTLVSIAPADTSASKEVARVRDTSDGFTPPTAQQSSKQPSTPSKPPTKAPVVQRTPLPRQPAAQTQRRVVASSGLRIAVDEPRTAEVARIFAAGVAAHRAGDATAARSAYEQVLAIAPNDVDALNNLGALYSSLREFDRAETALRKAIALSPNSAGPWNNLGAVLRERGKPVEAIAAFQHALAIDPHHAGARVGLAQQYLMIGSLPQARQLLEDVLRDTPTSPEASYALGQVLERQGDKAGAIRAYQTFARFAPPAFAAYVEGVRARMEALARP